MINRTILVVAREELVNSGYQAARMEAIAAAAGVSKGTLYDRYPSKEALLRAVIADRVATCAQNSRLDGGPKPSDLRGRLKHRARQLIQYACSGKLEELERLFSSSPPMSELRRMRHEVGHKPIVQTIAQDIIDATRDQSIELRAAVRMAEMLISTLFGWWQMHQEVQLVTRDEALRYANHVVDVLFDGRPTWRLLSSDAFLRRK